MGKEILIIGVYTIIGLLLSIGGLITSCYFNLGYYGDNMLYQLLGIIGGFFSFFIGVHILFVSIISLVKKKR